MEPFQLGKLHVSCVVEMNVPTSPRFLFPGIAPADFAPYRQWLTPHFYVPETDRFNMPIQAFVVRTPHHVLIIDTCVGNDKPRSNPAWNLQQHPFLANLKAQTGVTPDQVDIVLCTHLHVDHVGWNTRLVDGRWEPTFPNARYVLNRTEYDFWSKSEDEDQSEVFRDSVLPVMESGKAELVDGAHEVTEGVTLEPTPGHTPGHCSVHLELGGGEAVITGDMMHHPLQLLEPDRCSRFAENPEQTRRTRRAFLERYAERDVRVVGTHFAAPTCGRVVGHEKAFRFAV